MMLSDSGNLQEMKKLEEKLAKRKSEGNLRQLQTHDLEIDFYSNDYLGLARSKELSKAIEQKYHSMLDLNRMNGSTGSRLLSGNNKIFEDTEAFLAGIFRCEKTLLFNSGYNANLSLLSAVPGKEDTIIYDELIHASIKDGARLSYAKRYSFRHNDLADLETKLNNSQGIKFVVVEAVYSMDGDYCPLQDLAVLCERFSACLIVDEAHSTGLWGKDGSGLVCALGLEKKIFARIHTFGKALGIHGACIAGSTTLINYLINFARPFIYTTAFPVHSLASVVAAFEYIAGNNLLQKQLHEKINYFKEIIKQHLSAADVCFIDSNSPIQVVKVAGNKKAKELAAAIRHNRIDIRAILSPTVKEGEERLRICLHVYNTTDEMDYLVKSLKDAAMQAAY